MLARFDAVGGGGSRSNTSSLSLLGFPGGLRPGVHPAISGGGGWHQHQHRYRQHTYACMDVAMASHDRSSVKNLAKRTAPEGSYLCMVAHTGMSMFMNVNLVWG